MISRLATRPIALYRLPFRAFRLDSSLFTKNTEDFARDKYTKKDAETIMTSVLPKLESMNMK